MPHVHRSPFRNRDGLAIQRSQGLGMQSRAQDGRRSSTATRRGAARPKTCAAFEESGALRGFIQNFFIIK
jgi:hypothetical protein